MPRCAVLAARVDPPPDAAQFLAEHRPLFAELLAGAERVLFPSPSALASSVTVYTPTGAAPRLPHGYDPPERRRPERRSAGGRPAARGAARRNCLPVEGSGASTCGRSRVCRASTSNGTFSARPSVSVSIRSLDAAGARVVRHGAYRRAEVASCSSGADRRRALAADLAGDVFADLERAARCRDTGDCRAARRACRSPCRANSTASWSTTRTARPRRCAAGRSEPATCSSCSRPRAAFGIPRSQPGRAHRELYDRSPEARAQAFRRSPASGAELAALGEARSSGGRTAARA